jgi:hypothetical protein
MDHVRIGGAARSQAGSGESARTEIDKLQSQLDQLRARLLYPEPSKELGDNEVAQVRLIKEILRSRRRREKMFGEDF